MAKLKMLAIDLGASSGRGIVGTFDGNYFCAMNAYFGSDGLQYKMNGDKKVTTSVTLLDTVKNSTQIKIGSATAELSPNVYSTVELLFRFDYETMLYTRAELYVNGAYVGSVTLSDCAKLGYFRCFMTYKKDAGVDLDGMSLFTGAQTRYNRDDTMTEFVGYQTTAADENNKFNLRLVPVLTDNKLLTYNPDEKDQAKLEKAIAAAQASLKKYDYVGYNVTVSYKVGTTTYTEILNDANGGRCNSVFTSIMATDTMNGLETITAESLDGKYIFALNVQGISTEWTDIQFSVTTYYKLANYDKVFSDRTVNFTVDPATDVNQGGVN